MLQYRITVYNYTVRLKPSEPVQHSECNHSNRFTAYDNFTKLLSSVDSKSDKCFNIESLYHIAKLWTFKASAAF